MLRIVIPQSESGWDPVKEEFVYTKEQTLQLEHSLVSVSKWEEKWNKPFLSKADKTVEETIDYVRCMTITPNVDPAVYNQLTKENMEEIYHYINLPMTATWFSESEPASGSGKKTVITAEIIYYWMISYGIPVEFQKWHLNRLLTLIRVFEEKNKPPKKESKREQARRRRELNAARRKRLNSKG